MEKKKKTWWKSALEGGPEIDTQVRVHPRDPVIDAFFSLTVSPGGILGAQKVDSTCSIEDYDESTQAAISKVDILSGLGSCCQSFRSRRALHLGPLSEFSLAFPSLRTQFF